MLETGFLRTGTVTFLLGNSVLWGLSRAWWDV